MRLQRRVRDQNAICITDAPFNARPGVNHNNTEAIRAAALAGNSVWIPDGEFYLDWVEARAGQCWSGTGTLRATNATADNAKGLINVTGVDHVTIQDLKLVGVNRPEGGKETSQDGDRGINISNSWNIRVKYVDVSEFWSFGIVASRCDTIEFSNNRVHDIGNQSCIAIDNGSTTFEAAGNKCWNGKLYGIEIENGSKHGKIVLNECWNCVAGISINYGVADVFVRMNKIFNNNNRNTISGSSGIGIYMNGTSDKQLENITFNSNIITGNHAYALYITGGHDGLKFVSNLFRKGSIDNTNKLVEIAITNGLHKNVEFHGDTFDGSNTSILFTASEISFYKMREVIFKRPAGNLINLFGVCTDLSFEMPKLDAKDVIAAPNMENLGNTLRNWFFSREQKEQLVHISEGVMKRTLASLRQQKIVGIYWCVSARELDGTWLLSLDGSIQGKGVVGAVEKETWFYTPLNVLKRQGAYTLVELTNSIATTHGAYFKFRLVVV